MKRTIYRHVIENRPGETEIFREVLVDGTTILEREKVFDPMNSTTERKRYKIRERRVDPSFAGYDLIRLLCEKTGIESVDPTTLSNVIEINSHSGEKIEINFEQMRQVVVDHPRHHWSPAMTSVIAGLAGRANWDTPESAAA